MTEQGERLSIVSAERVREEFLKIVMSPDPRRGLTLLVDTGLCAQVLPELPLLRLEADVVMNAELLGRLEQLGFKPIADSPGSFFVEILLN